MINARELEKEIQKIKMEEEEQGIFHDNVSLPDLMEIILKLDKNEEEMHKGKIHY